MRVVHIACVAPPEVGGIGQAAAREVAGLRTRGIDARLFAPESRGTYPGNLAERSFIHTVQPRLRIGNGAFLPRWREELHGADIVHLHYPFYGFQEAMLFSQSPLPRVVATFHMDAAPVGWKGWLTSAHRHIIQPFLLNRIERLVVSSLDYARQSSLHGWYVRHPDRILELPFGVDTDFFSPGPSTRSRFSVPENAPTILFVGGLDSAHLFKGVHELLSAFALLGPQVQLLIVGDGDRRDAFETQARALGIAGRVHFLGRVDRETLRDAYRSADVFAFPSTSNAEAFGLAALEAQACGKPVVASALPGLRTVVQTEETGVLVPPKNIELLASALGRVLGDAVWRDALGGRARVRAQNQFSWEHHLARLEEMYRSLLDSPRV